MIKKLLAGAYILVGKGNATRAINLPFLANNFKDLNQRVIQRAFIARLLEYAYQGITRGDLYPSDARLPIPANRRSDRYRVKALFSRFVYILIKRNEGQPLSTEQFEDLDQEFLLPSERRNKDAKKIRWVLRANRLHPQGLIKQGRRA
jgi:hypothetical protein